MVESHPRAGAAGAPTERGSKEVPECPTCGRDNFETLAGMKRHHYYKHDESIAGRDTECEWCGLEFSKTENNHTDHDFCSQECFGEWAKENRSGVNHPRYKGGPREIECDWCGEVFERPPSQIHEERNFCSKRCHYDWNSENLHGESHPQYEQKTVECDWCGGGVKKHPNQIERSQRHFCDVTCMHSWRAENIVGERHPNYKGGYHPDYGNGWGEIRDDVLQRDDHRCQSCGVSESEYEPGLRIHHIRPFREFEDSDKANDLSNLVALCQPCHMKWEGVPIRPTLHN